jgi:hypothetical protein
VRPSESKNEFSQKITLGREAFDAFVADEDLLTPEQIAAFIK